MKLNDLKIEQVMELDDKYLGLHPTIECYGRPLHISEVKAIFGRDLSRTEKRSRAVALEVKRYVMVVMRLDGKNCIKGPAVRDGTDKIIENFFELMRSA